MINVTKPNLPPLEDFVDALKGIWDRNWLTNNGPLVNELELKIKQYLNLDHMLYLNNGTIALQIALKALGLENGSEIITTPFSYIATTSSILWEGYKPVFVDIDQYSFNIDITLIEKAITEKTSAILATHVFGNPCEIDAIEALANKYNLKVIYDAAHCFGTKYKGRSVFEFGDISTTSFHATKLFHTVEGGGVFTKKPEFLKIMAHMRNFGHNGPEDFEGIGINGKNSEFHAAMGLCNLKVVDNILFNRKEISTVYDTYLSPKITKQSLLSNSDFNFAYYPIVFESEEILLKCISALNGNYVFPRRYFYPSLNKIDYTQGTPMPISENIASRIVCLPLYVGLKPEEQDQIISILNLL